MPFSRNALARFKKSLSVRRESTDTPGRKYEDICPTTHTMYQPVLAQTVFDLMDIDEDDYLTLMSEDGTTREDLQLPEGELGQQIRESFDNDQDLSLTVLSWTDIEEAVISFKNAK
jgi:translation initiation factor 5A